MPKEVMLWDKDKLRSAKASKLREIGIYPSSTMTWGSGGNTVEVRGWYNSNEGFYFGSFATTEEARDFVERLHLQMKRGG